MQHGSLAKLLKQTKLWLRGQSTQNPYFHSPETGFSGVENSLRGLPF
jgi:hypothetical protein